MTQLSIDPPDATFGLSSELGFTEILVTARSFPQARRLGCVSLEVFLIAAEHARMKGRLDQRPSVCTQLTTNADAIEQLREICTLNQFPGFDALEVEPLPLGPWVSALEEPVRDGNNALEAAITVCLIEAHRLMTLHRVAIHEIGHAIVAAELMPDTPIGRFSIVPGEEFEGPIHWNSAASESTLLLSQDEGLQQICVQLAGHVAEQIKYGDDVLDDRCRRDLEGATQLAWQSITQSGLDPEFGGVDPNQIGKDGCRSLISGRAQEHINNMLAEALARTRTLLESNLFALGAIANDLFRNRTLTADDIYLYLLFTEVIKDGS